MRIWNMGLAGLLLGLAVWTSTPAWADDAITVHVATQETAAQLNTTSAGIITQWDPHGGGGHVDSTSSVTWGTSYIEGLQPTFRSRRQVLSIISI